MGSKERAEMYLELEAIVKELKEEKWRLSQVQTFIAQLDSLFKGEALDKALTLLEKPQNKQLLNLENLTELLHTVLNLETRKNELEKKLGMKVSLE